MTDPLLELDDVTYAWPGDDAPVLASVSLALEAGERVFLAGASGSGKSTLLALIGGLVAPAKGAIRFGGTRVDTLKRADRDRFRADHLGVIFQQFNLLPWLDAIDNVRLGCRFSTARARRTSVDEPGRLLGAMGLPEAAWSRRADRLSVGQQQRVAAARALIGRPGLILADEPTSALDDDRRDDFLDLLFDEVRNAGSALLFVSHDRRLADRFDRALSMDSLASDAGRTTC
ncbi:ATP-binding cassette domain-containing protein [Halomonas denitrificans]|nr:ATP-binding cassette domain-containing protein [Halomonas denitrificans]